MWLSGNLLRHISIFRKQNEQSILKDSLTHEQYPHSLLGLAEASPPRLGDREPGGHRGPAGTDLSPGPCAAPAEGWEKWSISRDRGRGSATGRQQGHPSAAPLGGDGSLTRRQTCVPRGGALKGREAGAVGDEMQTESQSTGPPYILKVNLKTTQKPLGRFKYFFFFLVNDLKRI